MNIPDEAVQAAQATYMTFGIDDEMMREALKAALPFLQGVKVKALTWKEYEGEQGTSDSWDAVTGTGDYYFIGLRSDGYTLSFDYSDIGTFNNLEAAKAAAQAGYEARIRSAIETADTIETYYARQIEWSKNTFGPALRTLGILDHIRKELKEIEADPHDMSEWIDVVILAMDGFWRHGGAVNDLMPRLLAKQQKNMARDWADWRTMSEDSAIEHDRSKDPAPSPRVQAFEEVIAAERMKLEATAKVGLQLSEQVEALEAENKRLREALVMSEAAISEFYRYQYGGEMRGSFDGKPERDGLWKAMHKARAALGEVKP